MNPKCRKHSRHSQLVHPGDGKLTKSITKKRVVITSAQNATPVFKPFWDSLRVYCKENDAQLLVVPYRYHNPTAIWSEAGSSDDWWAPEVVPYLVDARTELNVNLVLLADIKTQPTATSPLSGFETMTGPVSAILGHPKLELTTIPTPQSKLPKILTTTGSCTKPNYLPGKAGKKGEFHHTFGAAVVELKGDVFHLRQINAVRDGTFMELAGPKKHATKYTPTGVEQGGVVSLIMGDNHLEFADPDVFRATFKHKTGILDQLKPKYLVWHDLHDFYSRLHHHIFEPFINYVKHIVGTDDVEAMLDKTFATIDQINFDRPWLKNIFVPSNHPDALAKWVKRADWKSDPRNAKFLLRTALAMLDGSKWTEIGAETIDPFAYWATKKLRTAGMVKFLTRDEGFMVKGVDVGHHGDDGPNGSRGTRKAFGKIGVKTVIGHSHSPGIDDGVYQVGTNGLLRVEWMRGCSSWLHTDCVIYDNGKRTLLNIIYGNWRI